MAATVISTANVAWADGINPAGQTIAVPSDCTAVYVFWRYYSTSNGVGLASMTLAGSGYNEAYEDARNAAFESSAGVAAFYNPSTGNQTLDPAWDVEPDAASQLCTVVYVKGGDTTGWRDADAVNNAGTGALSITLTTESGDLVLKYDTRYGTGTPPANTSGWTSLTTQGNTDGYDSRTASIEATTTTQACPAENENYTNIVAIAVKAGAANVTASPTVGTLRAVGQQPTTGKTESAAPGAGTLRAIGQQPTATTSANQWITAQVGTLRITGQQPTAATTANQWVSPSVGTLRAIGQQPTTAATANQWITANVGTLRLIGQQPTVTSTVALEASPSAGTLRLTGQQPTATTSANQWITAGAGTVVHLGQQPTTAIAWPFDQALYPTAVSLTGLTGAYTDIDDDPSTPDGNWLMAA